MENIPDEQAGEEQVPFELEEDLLEQQLEELEDDDMPDLEEELPPYVTVEKDDDPSRAQPPPPLLTSELPPENQPELPRRSLRNKPRKKTISEELNCKFVFIFKTLV